MRIKQDDFIIEELESDQRYLNHLHSELKELFQNKRNGESVRSSDITTINRSIRTIKSTMDWKRGLVFEKGDGIMTIMRKSMDRVVISDELLTNAIEINSKLRTAGLNKRIYPNQTSQHVISFPSDITC